MLTLTRHRQFALAILIVVGCSASAADLYVNNSGSPVCSDSFTRAQNIAGGGTSNVWCTLLRATWGTTDGNRNSPSNPSEAARAGDIVYVTAGTYEYTGASFDQGSFSAPGLYQSANEGSAGSWITYEAVGTVHLTGNMGGRAWVIGSHGKEYIKWVGFTIDQNLIGHRRGNGVVSIFDSNIWLDRLTIIGEYTDYGADDNHAGIFIHGPRDGDCLSGALTGVIVSNSTIHGFTGNNGNNDTGMTLYCLRQVTIENNEIYDNYNGILAKSSYTDSPYRSYVRYNLIRSNGGSGIRFQSWADFDIYQNVIRDNTNSCLKYHAVGYTVGNDKPKDMYFVNNTCDNNRYGVYIKGFGSDCSDYNGNFTHNNIVTNAMNAVYNEGCRSPVTDIGTDDIDFEYNVYEHSGNFFDGENTASFATWRSTYGQDASSSTSANCLYADESANDFRLCSAAGVPVAGCSRRSPCLAGGANDGVDILDLDGDASTIDALTIGAYVTNNETIGPADPPADGSAPTNLHRTDVIESR